MWYTLGGIVVLFVVFDRWRRASGGGRVVPPNRFFLPVLVCIAPLWPGCEPESGPNGFASRVQELGGTVDYVFDEAPFRSCHASSITTAPNGDLLCVWFGGAGEGNDDVGIWGARLREGQWSRPTVWAKVREQAHWNPVLFRDQAGQVHLFFKVGPNTRDWQTYWMHLQENGHWTAPQELVGGNVGGRGPVKNKPIVLSDGTWLAPASTEHRADEPMPHRRPFADASPDGGTTWIRSPDFPPPRSPMGAGAIQPTFWESVPGHVHALMRTGSGRIWRSDSTDRGATWSPMAATSLPNNNSGIDLTQLPDGRLVLASNPIGVPFGFRNILALAVSDDNGIGWQTVAYLEYAVNPFVEYSYPTVVSTGEELIISYTWQREKIKMWRIPYSAIG